MMEFIDESHPGGDYPPFMRSWFGSLFASCIYGDSMDGDRDD